MGKTMPLVLMRVAVSHAEGAAKLSAVLRQLAQTRDKAAGWQPTSAQSTGGPTMQGGAAT